MAVEKRAATAGRAVMRVVRGEGRPSRAMDLAWVACDLVMSQWHAARNPSRKLTSVNETLLTGRYVTDVRCLSQAAEHAADD